MDIVELDARRLSRLLWDCREIVEMYLDVVEGRGGRRSEYLRRILGEIEAYRAERGWDPDGFGGETG